jgi:hypothetical protein
MSWSIEFHFIDTRIPIENQLTILTSLPTKGDVIHMTDAFIGLSEDDDWTHAPAWVVEDIKVYLRRRSEFAYITMKPWVP